MNDANLPPEAQQLLAQMHDIRAPEAVSWWPLAPGWWLLIALLIALISGTVFLLQRRAQRNRYRREALAMLATVAAHPQAHSLSDINEIVKRAALYAYPQERADIARAYGEQWVHWLNSKTEKPAFTGNAADTLAMGTYSGKDDATADVIVSARQWLQTHHHGPAQRGRRHA